MRSKVLVSALVVLALLFSFGMSEKASADTLLFPWIVKSGSVLTLLSVVNTADSSCSALPRLHYQYWFKDASSATANTDSCTAQSFQIMTSKNDLVSFDATGNISSGAALFNDNDFDHKGVDYSPNNFSMDTAPATARAFLLVDNNTDTCFDSLAHQASLYGEALVVELSQGAAWGYVAYNASYGGPGDEPYVSFADGMDMQGEVLRSPRYFDSGTQNGDQLETTPTILLPLSTFKTKFFVTPVNYSWWEYSSAGPGQRVGNSNSRIQFCSEGNTIGSFPLTSPCSSPLSGINFSGDNCQKDADATCRGGVYDNDESIMDGNQPVNVVCTSALDIETSGLLTAAQIDWLKTTRGTQKTGGNAWTYVRSLVGSFAPQGQLGNRNTATLSDSIVGKLEYSDSPSGFVVGGTTVHGAVNDFKWIRNSGSQDDTTWDLMHGINNVEQED
jgi:hypothetical protein